MDVRADPGAISYETFGLGIRNNLELGRGRNDISVFAYSSCVVLEVSL